MKMLLERADALVASTKDWFTGKERELHREQAELLQELAQRVHALEASVEKEDVYHRIGLP